MELPKIYPDSHLDSTSFYSGGELTVQLWMLNLSGWTLRQGVLQVFQISSLWNINSSGWEGDCSILILIWTPSAFRMGGEKTLKLWLLIHIGWNLGLGLLQSFWISSYSIHTNSRWTCNSYSPIPVWTPSAFMLGEHRLSSCEFGFTGDGTWARGYSSHLKSFLNEFKTVSAVKATNLFWVQSGLPWLYHWGENRLSRGGFEVAMDSTLGVGVVNISK